MSGPICDDCGLPTPVCNMNAMIRDTVDRCGIDILRSNPSVRGLIDEAVADERERIAAWHDREADGAMNSLHCGSENSEYRAANRLHDFHKASAAAIRGQT